MLVLELIPLPNWGCRIMSMLFWMDYHIWVSLSKNVRVQQFKCHQPNSHHHHHPHQLSHSHPSITLPPALNPIQVHINLYHITYHPPSKPTSTTCLIYSGFKQHNHPPTTTNFHFAVIDYQNRYISHLLSPGLPHYNHNIPKVPIPFIHTPKDRALLLLVRSD